MADDKRAHYFRSVDVTAEYDPAVWFGGASAAVRAALAQARARYAAGAGQGVPAPLRAPSFRAARRQLELASARRLGGAVLIVGRSTDPGLRAGDRVTLQSGSSRRWRLDPALALAGEYGIVEVVHTWTGQLYENTFVATPWRGYHPAPETLAGHTLAEALLGSPYQAAGTPSIVGAGGGAQAWGLRGPLGPASSSPVTAGVSSSGGRSGHLTGVDGPRVAALTTLRSAELAAALARAGATGAADGTAGAAPLTIGLVVANADPTKQGRVRVRFPWQDPEEPATAAGWARVAGPYAGRHRGLGALPEVGDEVLVAFRDGSPEQPVVVGALWNGRDEAAHTPDVKQWVTRSGAALRFVDAPGQELAELQSPAGSCLVQLLHRGPGGVPLLTAHSEGHVAVEAPSGEVRISGRRIVLDASEGVTVRAGSTLAVKTGGAAAVEVGGSLEVGARADVALVAGAGLRAHAGGAHVLTGATVQMNPPGAGAPRVVASVPALAASIWAARAVPAAAPPQHTADGWSPELAARPERREPRKSWLAVRVLVGGEPAPDVLLTVTPSGGGEAEGSAASGWEQPVARRTDGDGAVVGTHVPAGAYAVRITARNWPPPLPEPTPGYVRDAGEFPDYLFDEDDVDDSPRDLLDVADLPDDLEGDFA